MGDQLAGVDCADVAWAACRRGRHFDETRQRVLEARALALRSLEKVLLEVVQRAGLFAGNQVQKTSRRMQGRLQFVEALGQTLARGVLEHLEAVMALLAPTRPPHPPRPGF